jgi:hypothetical protein
MADPNNPDSPDDPDRSRGFQGLSHSPNCRTCTSPHRVEIDRRLLAGGPLGSTRAVERWLVETHGEAARIRHDALARHKRDHCNPLPDAQRIVAERDEQRRVAPSSAGASPPHRPSRERPGRDEEAEHRTQREREAKEQRRIEAEAKAKESAAAFASEVERLVADAGVLDEVASLAMHAARKLAPVVSDDPTQAQATVFGDALKHARGAVTDRYELLHGKKVNVEGAGAGLVGLLALDLDEPPPRIEGDEPLSFDPLSDEAAGASARRDPRRDGPP